MTLFHLPIWDLDGTLQLNDLPQPDWENPNARHPTTLEPVTGEMLLYWSHNYPNPEIQPGDLENITHILTGRPEIRRRRTLSELRRFGIREARLIMYPTLYSWSIRQAVDWKAEQLLKLGATHYIDNDQAFNQQLRQKLHGTVCCLTVAEYHDLLDAGVL
ncbi:MAG: hypothetical protein PHW36_00675 [Bacilli bacterium]|nr:hypothetical protein [Bacilli bacterium]